MANDFNPEHFATMDAWDVFGELLYAGVRTGPVSNYVRIYDTEPLQVNNLAGTQYIQVPLFTPLTIYVSDCDTCVTAQDLTITNKEIEIKTRYATINICTNELLSLKPSEFTQILDQIRNDLNQKLADEIVTELANGTGGPYGTFNTAFTLANVGGSAYRGIAEAGFYQDPEEEVIFLVGSKAFSEIGGISNATTKFIRGAQVLEGVFGAVVVLNPKVVASGVNTTNFAYKKSAIGLGFPENMDQVFVKVQEGDVCVPAIKWAIGLNYGVKVLNPAAIFRVRN